MENDKNIPVGVRLPASDFELLAWLSNYLRGTQSSTVSMALRHLNETINRGESIYVNQKEEKDNG